MKVLRLKIHIKTIMNNNSSKNNLFNKIHLFYKHLCTYMTTRFASMEFSMTSSLNRKCRFVLSFIASNSASVIATAQKQ